MLQGAILALGLLLPSQRPSSTWARVALLRQTEWAIMRPPPHGAEHWLSGVSDQVKVLRPQPGDEAGEEAGDEAEPPQTPQRSTRRVESRRRSHPTG